MRRVRALVSNLRTDGVSAPILAQTLEYWHKVDKDLGERFTAGMNDR